MFSRAVRSALARTESSVDFSCVRLTPDRLAIVDSMPAGKASAPAPTAALAANAAKATRVLFGFCSVLIWIHVPFF